MWCHVIIMSVSLQSLIQKSKENRPKINITPYGELKLSGKIIISLPCEFPIQICFAHNFCICQVLNPFLSHLYASTGRAMAVTTALVSASALLKMLKVFG